MIQLHTKLIGSINSIIFKIKTSIPSLIFMVVIFHTISRINTSAPWNLTSYKEIFLKNNSTYYIIHQLNLLKSPIVQFLLFLLTGSWGLLFAFLWALTLWPNPRQSLRFYGLLSKITVFTLPTLPLLSVRHDPCLVVVRLYCRILLLETLPHLDLRWPSLTLLVPRVRLGFTRRVKRGTCRESHLLQTHLLLLP